MAFEDRVRGLAEELGWQMEFSETWITIRRGDRSATINKEDTALDTVAQVMTFLLGIQRTKLPNNEMANRLYALEERVKRLEDSEFKHYLALFKAKLPEFSHYGITITIDEERRQVVYQNEGRKPIVYEISRAGYYGALRALNHVKNNHKCRD